jgi:hypothetical protein
LVEGFEEVSFTSGARAIACHENRLLKKAITKCRDDLERHPRFTIEGHEAEEVDPAGPRTDDLGPCEPLGVPSGINVLSR